jgi:hypothetical protein
MSPLEQDLHRWDAWRPEDAARLLVGVKAPWYVAAGWAIDLFLGGQRREHEDLEIAVPRDRFPEVAEALAAYELFVPGREDGRALVWPLAEAAERLETHHQTWVREPATGTWRMDIFREPSDGDLWICRGDESIRLPYDDVILRTSDWIPYLRPELVLLFKAKHSHRERDRADLDAVVPLLEPDRRRWLARTLTRVHPGHEWVQRL